MEIATIEQELKTGQVEPGRLAQMKDWLSAESSSLMDRQDELIDEYNLFFFAHRKDYKSDKGTDNAWAITEKGREQRKLETWQLKAKRLISAINSHLEVANNQAFGRY